MSISGALASAVSGLTASSRAAAIVSSNVANAMTDGFARRELQLSARVVGGAGAGVQVDGVLRLVDAAVLRDRRLADGAVAFSAGTASFFDTTLRQLGDPGDPGSLPGLLRTFESRLQAAASRPESEARLDAVRASAQALVDGFNAASDAIQISRQDADARIATDVEALNRDLLQVRDLNAAIARLNGAGQDVSGLLDQRQTAVDRISQLVPVTELARDDGKIALVSQGGAILLDSTAAEIGFTATPTITAEMSLQSAALSGLTLNGRPIAVEGSRAPLGGGGLAAQFAVRDSLAPDAQTALDAVARDLIERFADPGTDPTVLAGQPGLFTDGGGALLPANEVGLAGRLALNTAIEPAAGGELWRLRDGLGAPAPGPVGNATQLTSFADAISARRSVASGPFGPSMQSSDGLIAALVTRVSTLQATAETDLTARTTQRDTLEAVELRDGVDTDQEMQKLLLIEQSYAANAQVIRAVESMIDQLLGL